jgi:hypothetical protein
MTTYIDKILNELSYRVSNGTPNFTNEQHLIKLFDVLKELDWSIEGRVELLKNLNELNFKNKETLAKYASKHKMRPSTKVTIGGKETTAGEELPDPKDKKDKKVKHSLKTDEQRDKKLHEVAELFIDDDAEKVRGSGRFSMSKQDVQQYRDYLKLSSEERQAKVDEIKRKQREKVGEITEQDIDDSIEHLREKLGSKKFNALKQSIKKKGDPPPEYSKGEAGEERFRSVIKHYLETGGVSPITGEVVPFHDSQLDHITSLDNGGEDGPENWMWMESRMNQFKGKLTDEEVERKLIEKGLMSVNEITQETEQEELDNWNKEAEIAYWEIQIAKGDTANLSQEKIDNMTADELDNLIKAYNRHVGKNDPRYVPRYGTRKVEVKGSEKPLEISRGGDVRPDPDNPDSWGLHKGGDGTMSEPTLKDDSEGYKKALAIYEKSRLSGGKKITKDEKKESIKSRLASDNSPLGGPIPDKSAEEGMDEVMEAIVGEKVSRKQSIDDLNAKIKDNPKSSARAKKKINKEFKATELPDEIKKAKGKGSAKEPDDPEAYDAAIEKKTEFLLAKWREWEKKLEAK